MVVLNALHPPFNDARARQALYYLVNQKQMLAAMGYPDKYRVDYCATLYICGSPLATDAGAAPYAKPDPARARQLLQEAGYKGEKVVLLYPTDHLSAPAVMVLSQNLKKAGVNVDLQSMDWASLAARRLKKDPPAQAAGTCSDLGRLLRRQHAGHQPLAVGRLRQQPAGLALRQGAGRAAHRLDPRDRRGQAQGAGGPHPGTRLPDRALRDVGRVQARVRHARPEGHRADQGRRPGHVEHRKAVRRAPAPRRPAQVPGNAA